MLRLREGKIDALLPPSIPEPSEGVRDFGGAFLIPGLIDTHCHMIFRGDGHWSDGYLENHTPERLLLIAAENGRRALSAGITTLRDLGGPARPLLELRAAAEEEEFPFPRLLLSGSPLTTTGGHGWDLGGEVDSAEEIVKTIRLLARQGVDVVKVMASGGGTRGTSPGTGAFPLDMLRLMSDTAHERGLSIVAHATCPEAVRNCATAGFDGVEHAGFWAGDPLVNGYADDIAAVLAERKLVVAPTLQASYRTLHELPGQTQTEKVRREQLVSDAFDNFRKMLAHDIFWVAGSDAGYMINPFGDLALGLRLMVDNGMTPTEALASATTRSAEALGLSDRIGRLAPGFDADLVVIDGNPLEDIDACKRVCAVYREGCAVV